MPNTNAARQKLFREKRKQEIQVMTTWAIRDITHGKTFHFTTWEELTAFVKKAEKVGKNAT